MSPMQHAEPLFLGRTFDDFLFRPQHSPVRTRREVSLAMPLVAGLDLALPVLGANMDTVVGEEMAKTLALEGGIGITNTAFEAKVEHTEEKRSIAGFTCRRVAQNPSPAASRPSSSS